MDLMPLWSTWVCWLFAGSWSSPAKDGSLPRGRGSIRAQIDIHGGWQHLALGRAYFNIPARPRAAQSWWEKAAFSDNTESSKPLLIQSWTHPWLCVRIQEAIWFVFMLFEQITLSNCNVILRLLWDIIFNTQCLEITGELDIGVSLRFPPSFWWIISCLPPCNRLLSLHGKRGKRWRMF